MGESAEIPGHLKGRYRLAVCAFREPLAFQNNGKRIPGYSLSRPQRNRHRNRQPVEFAGFIPLIFCDISDILAFVTCLRKPHEHFKDCKTMTPRCNPLRRNELALGEGCESQFGRSVGGGEHKM
eukprot:989080-Rhodomonas_salina.3